MRFVLCIVIAALLPVSALAAKGGGGAMSLTRAQAAAAKGDQKAAAVVATTTNRDTCLSGVALVGFQKINVPAPAARAFATPLPSSRTACRSSYSAASIRFFRFGVARRNTGARNCPV
jgi:Mg2+/Co2+ transporter CorB